MWVQIQDAIYQKEDGKALWVILVLAEEENLKEVMFHNQYLEITLSSDHKLKIELPGNCSIDPKSIKCKCCKEVVTFLMDTKPRQ